MLENFAIGSVVLALLVAAWYGWFWRLNRRRSTRILGWIERAFSGHGSIRSVRWDSASCFHVELRLCPAVFRQASLAVRLEPREMPLRWLLSRMLRRQETVTFEAELDVHRGFDLYVQKHHWLAGSRRVRPKSLEGWDLHNLVPMVLSTQAECQNKIGHALDALLAARSSRFLQVTFRTQAPQFAACAPLQSLSPDERGAEIFDMLQTLASCASTSPH